MYRVRFIVCREATQRRHPLRRNFRSRRRAETADKGGRKGRWPATAGLARGEY